MQLVCFALVHTECLHMHSEKNVKNVLDKHDNYITLLSKMINMLEFLALFFFAWEVKITLIPFVVCSPTKGSD